MAITADSAPRAQAQGLTRTQIALGLFLLAILLCTATLCVDGEKSLDELLDLARSTRFTRVSDWIDAYLLRKHPLKDEIREDWAFIAEPATSKIFKSDMISVLPGDGLRGRSTVFTRTTPSWTVARGSAPSPCSARNTSWRRQ